MSTEPARPLPAKLHSSPDLARANTILKGAKCWIGWESFEEERAEIHLDGYLSIEELEALLFVMKHGAA